jgi:hypothetical protein
MYGDADGVSARTRIVIAPDDNIALLDLRAQSVLGILRVPHIRHGEKPVSGLSAVLDRMRIASLDILHKYDEENAKIIYN